MNRTVWACENCVVLCCDCNRKYRNMLIVWGTFKAKGWHHSARIHYNYSENKAQGVETILVIELKLNMKSNKAKPLRVRHHVLRNIRQRVLSAWSKKRWSRTTSSMLRRVEDLLLQGRVIQQGDMLLQRPSLFKRSEWHKHSFVLCEDKFYFFNKQRPTTFADGGVVSIPNLTSLKAQELRDSKGEARFCMQMCMQGLEPFMFQCETEEERNTWLTALLATKAMSLLKDLKLDCELVN